MNVYKTRCELSPLRSCDSHLRPAAVLMEKLSMCCVQGKPCLILFKHTDPDTAASLLSPPITRNSTGDFCLARGSNDPLVVAGDEPCCRLDEEGVAFL